MGTNVSPRKQPELFGLTFREPEAAALLSFQERYSIPLDQQIVCPGMGRNVCASTVFGPDNVMNIVTAESDCQALQAAGYRSTRGLFADYYPKAEADLLVSIDGDGEPTPSALWRAVRVGGLAVVNNLTDWAVGISRVPHMQLVSAFLPDIRHPDAYWADGPNLADSVRNITPSAHHHRDILTGLELERSLVLGARAGLTNHIEELRALRDLEYLEPDPEMQLRHGSFYDALFIFRREA